MTKTRRKTFVPNLSLETSRFFPETKKIRNYKHPLNIMHQRMLQERQLNFMRDEMKTYDHMKKEADRHDQERDTNRIHDESRKLELKKDSRPPEVISI